MLCAVEGMSQESAHSPSLYVPLPKPPSAFSLTVRRLLGRVVEGAIRVPEFQRPLRWNARDVVKLFDSILKGYPVGSLLFWKRTFEKGNVLIGAARISAPLVQDGWSIIDGQQRITALSAALSDLPQAGDLRWLVRWDPATNEFLSGPAEGEVARQQVPLSALGDLRRLGHWLRQCDLSDEAQSRVEAVQQRILDYELPAYLLETDDVDALRGVFARLNSTGVRMRADEVFQALLGGGTIGKSSHVLGASTPTSTSRHAGSGAGRGRIELRLLQEGADVDGFGQPPRTEMLKCLLAMSGLDPSKRLDDLGDGAVARLISADEAVEGIRRAAAFLQSPIDGAVHGAGIPAYAFVPYPVVLILLARWFHLFPEPDEATRKTLARWVWRGIATGVHQRAAVSAMRRQIRHIRDGDPIGSLRSLLHTVGEPTQREWVMGPFHANQAASRVEMLSLLSLEPRSPLGTISWRALVSSGQRMAREIFSVPRLEAPERTLGRTVANRVLLDARHTGLVTEIRKWSWDEDREALESHLIDQEAFDCLKASRQDAAQRQHFLRSRASRVRALVTRFLAKRTGVGEPTILVASAYYDSDGFSEADDATIFETEPRGAIRLKTETDTETESESAAIAQTHTNARAEREGEKTATETEAEAEAEALD
ncbi:MAG: DUF262 domain-containing protein [Deltaproteobacteria bacterium]|nr:DUF262 domain-containing protein [Deltaproteobacteria bacterium]